MLNAQFIQITDRAVYEPQEKNPQGEINKEIAFIIYDQNQQKHVLQEFHVEGYVNQYVLEDLEIESKKFVFTTEAIENMPPGWQARTIYEIFVERSVQGDLRPSGPSQEWICFMVNDFRRELLILSSGWEVQNIPEF